MAAVKWHYQRQSHWHQEQIHFGRDEMLSIEATALESREVTAHETVGTISRKVRRLRDGALRGTIRGPVRCGRDPASSRNEIADRTRPGRPVHRARPQAPAGIQIHPDPLELPRRYDLRRSAQQR